MAKSKITFYEPPWYRRGWGAFVVNCTAVAGLVIAGVWAYGEFGTAPVRRGVVVKTEGHGPGALRYEIAADPFGARDWPSARRPAGMEQDAQAATSAAVQQTPMERYAPPLGPPSAAVPNEMPSGANAVGGNSNSEDTETD